MPAKCRDCGPSNIVVVHAYSVHPWRILPQRDWRVSGASPRRPSVFSQLDLSSREPSKRVYVGLTACFRAARTLREHGRELQSGCNHKANGQRSRR